MYQILTIILTLFFSTTVFANENRSIGCYSEKPQIITTHYFYKGELREFIISIPENYNSKKTHNLVFAFHGRTNSNKDVKDYYDLERFASQRTIFVYPKSLKVKDGTNSWGDDINIFDYELFDFISFLISYEYCVDPGKIFLVGHSLGASFSNSLACARGDKVRAVASLGGGGLVDNCNGNFAAMVIHNPKDRLVSFKNGKRVKEAFIENNGLKGKSKKIRPKKLNCKKYDKGNKLNPVVWCPHKVNNKKSGKYYPHNWPENTGKYIMEFFESLEK